MQTNYNKKKTILIVSDYDNRRGTKKKPTAGLITDYKSGH